MRKAECRPYLDLRSVAARLLAEAGRARAERRHTKVRLALRPRHVARLRIGRFFTFPSNMINIPKQYQRERFIVV